MAIRKFLRSQPFHDDGEEGRIRKDIKRALKAPFFIYMDVMYAVRRRTQASGDYQGCIICRNCRVKPDPVKALLSPGVTRDLDGRAGTILQGRTADLH